MKLMNVNAKAYLKHNSWFLTVSKLYLSIKNDDSLYLGDFLLLFPFFFFFFSEAESHSVA